MVQLGVARPVEAHTIAMASYSNRDLISPPGEHVPGQMTSKKARKGGTPGGQTRGALEPFERVLSEVAMTDFRQILTCSGSADVVHEGRQVYEVRARIRLQAVSAFLSPNCYASSKRPQLWVV